jgi:hypothetical protein
MPTIFTHITFKVISVGSYMLPLMSLPSPEVIVRQYATFSIHLTTLKISVADFFNFPRGDI